METLPSNRRDFLKRISAAGALGLGASTVLAACGGGESAGDGPAAASGCMDTTGLAEADIAMRNQLGYVDVTPDPEKLCTGCALWVPAPAGATCGGCNLLKGPIHPDGWCVSWAPAQT